MNHETGRPRIAFLTAYDLNDISRWSWAGTFYHMAQALQEHCGEVTQLGPLSCWEQPVARGIHKVTRQMLKKNFTPNHCFLVAKKYGRIAAKRLAGQAFDVIFAPSAEPEIAFLKTDIPIVLVEDATYGQLINYYPAYSNLLKRSVYELNALEKQALDKASLVVLWSEWAARSVIDGYQVHPEKVRVVPSGANFNTAPAEEQVLRREKSGSCRLLFVGVDWERKGGEIAFEALLKLHEMGIQAELIVCGCTPPEGFSHAYMRVIPFLDKNDARQRQELETLYMTSDFLFLPTRCDAYGLVFCEASAYGLPAITTNTGGVSGVVVEGENGFMLPSDARGDEYARLIAQLYQDDQCYAALVRSSRSVFEGRLNWDAWGRSMANLITELLDQARSSKRSHEFELKPS
jgi:glycosyltransferase involved in cell wall biosynthesis